MLHCGSECRMSREARDARDGPRARGAPSFALCAMLLGTALCAPLAAAMPVAQRVAPGVYVVPGTGAAIEPSNAGRIANIAFVVGPRGVVVVGAGVSAAHGRDVIAAVEHVTALPIRLVVLTHAGREVILGAAAFRERRIPILMHRNAAALMAARCDECLARLRALLGDAAMAGSRIVEPQLLVAAGQPLDLIGRRLVVVAPAETANEGAIAVLDPQSGTLMAGSLVTVDRVPDLGDHDGAGWSEALDALAATHCRHLVPALGRLGTCADIEAMRGYFTALEDRVRALVAGDVPLSEVSARAALPRFAGWDAYADLHGANAQRTYLRIERTMFIH